MGGIWGTLSTGLFATPALVESTGVGNPGLFYGGGGTQLGVQALGIVASGGVVFPTSHAVFRGLKANIGLMVQPEEERNRVEISGDGGYRYSEQLVAPGFRNGHGGALPG